ncbi:hypothetical protein [Companilactobacillus nantensis]|uniref:Uncharacterized protein n=1 Tax=Companilactobacillus nantensis DSM 16982 TaxID=1423774 RepID=A0A0R1WHV3_9LACO|nr:hypothetical protein [Companilactobacillus nantensis]KRM17486.1 hypothetical protein FD31_GL002679 [Companilactobacillus nantensis DSM 16982]GEO64461.1 hypothetical protein LNA01_16440 [Companilactobacillus nantensis]
MMIEFPRKDEITTKLAVLVPKNDNENYSSVVGFVVDKVVGDVSNYVHIPIDSIPEELDMTIISMCIQMIDTHELLTPVDDRNDGVTSLSEGDISVSFKTPADVYSTLQSVNSITDNFIAQLNSFRRIQR